MILVTSRQPFRFARNLVFLACCVDARRISGRWWVLVIRLALCRLDHVVFQAFRNRHKVVRCPVNLRNNEVMALVIERGVGSRSGTIISCNV
jgi:hypothetical protein